MDKEEFLRKENKSFKWEPITKKIATTSKGFCFFGVIIYDLILGILVGLVLILVVGLDLVLIKLFGRLFYVKWLYKNFWSGIYSPHEYVLRALYLKWPNSGHHSRNKSEAKKRYPIQA